MVDIFRYLMLLVGSELLLLVKQSVHNCTWILAWFWSWIAYYHFNDFTRLKYCWIRCRLAVLGLRMVLVPGSTFTSLKNSLTTLTNLGKNYMLFCLSLSPIYIELRLLQSQGSTSVGDIVAFKISYEAGSLISCYDRLLCPIWEVSRCLTPSCARFKGVQWLYKSGKHSVLTTGRPSSESRTMEHVGWEVENTGPQEEKDT
jgi:hypothetical protein